MNSNATQYLLPGERIVWEGNPAAALIFRPIEAFLIPFSLLWAGFAVFWNVSVWTMNGATADLPFKLFGLPFLLTGLYITAGRFWLDRRLRQNLYYFVTNRRILILKGASRSTLKSVDIERLPALELNERADGSGTIRFGPPVNWFGSNNLAIWQPTFDPTPQFIRIPNVRSVYALIQNQAAR